MKSVIMRGKLQGRENEKAIKVESRQKEMQKGERKKERKKEKKERKKERRKVDTYRCI